MYQSSLEHRPLPSSKLFHTLGQQKTLVWEAKRQPGATWWLQHESVWRLIYQEIYTDPVKNGGEYIRSELLTHLE